MASQGFDGVHLVRNPLSILGASIALMTFGGLIFFFGLQVLDVEPSPYIGMVVYVALPAVLVVGLLLVPAGMAWEARRRRVAALRGEGVPHALVLDFGNPRHLFAVLGFATTTMLVLGLLGATGFRAVEFMESPRFCGDFCHTAMEPQYEPYKQSAHAEVKCTNCHIGPGAGWYVQSKLSGASQMLAVLTDSYPRPIPAPIEHLRPARDTCEGCHWREKAYGMFLRVYRSYLPDEENTLHLRALAFRVGTGGSELEKAGGVHWHTSARLWYWTTDDTRQTIAAVFVVKEDGEKNWVNPDIPSDAQLEGPRLMDCIDCHNRAAHKIPEPASLIDDALSSGRMDPALPYLKRESARLLGADGSVGDPVDLAALWKNEGWFEQLRTFYERSYPNVASTRGPAIDQAIEELKRISGQVVYPEMKTSWLTYPDNRGHPGVEGAGCFRCHTTLVSQKTGERLAGGVGKGGCLACHGFGDAGTQKLGGDPLDEPACAYCHVSIPLQDLERRITSDPVIAP